MDLVSQNLLLTSSGKKDSTYVDDVFSTYLFKGNSSTQTITNGIDLSGEGGLVWSKTRDVSDNHRLTDTERGANKTLSPDANFVEYTNSGLQGVSQFNSNGFVSGLSNSFYNNQDIASWTFRKAKGLVDIVEFSGNGNSSQVISHSLGSVPGMILLKAKNQADNWKVYHRGHNGGVTPEKWATHLNTDQAASEYTQWWNDTAPTATNFTVGEWNNASGWDWIAYVFAGGESTAATARSVDLDGNDWLTVPNSSDFNTGSGDFTIEAWIKPDVSATSYNGIWSYGNPHEIMWRLDGSAEKIQASFKGTEGGSYVVELASTGTGSQRTPRGQWSHVAIVRNGNNFNLYLNGNLADNATYSGSIAGAASDSGQVGNYKVTGNPSTYPFKGFISNFRFVKGTAVYTESFRPPYEPLTNVTNTKLLCCNNSSVTGSTVSPGTITANGDPTASTDSPFDDPAGFVFGDSSTENIIKCGSFETTSSSPNAKIELGWEPQFVITKRTDNTSDWLIWDTMRGWTSSGDIDAYLDANTGDAEVHTSDYGGPTSTGFENNGVIGYSAQGIYIAIRRPDGYVGKPPELGTDVFAMDTGSGSSVPAMDSGFPVDFALKREPASTNSWRTAARLMGAKGLFTDTSGVEYSASSFVWDSNVGWLVGASSAEFSWMWKRHAGCDVVTYNGQNSAFDLPHSLNAVPEMIWFKSRNTDVYWYVYHKGLNGGTNARQYFLVLNLANAEQFSGTPGQILSLTSTHVGLYDSNGAVNLGGRTYIAMLFASVDGISKVGYYDGTGYTGNVITTGFAPRFVIVKCTTTAASWVVWDTTRGVGNFLLLNDNNPQGSASVVTFNSTGFTLTGTSNSSNGSGQKYVYYAHA